MERGGARIERRGGGDEGRVSGEMKGLGKKKVTEIG